MIKILDVLNEEIVSPGANKLLRWFADHANHTYVFFDTETTGRGPSSGDQLTQIGAIATYFNTETLRFAEIDRFNVKIKLNPEMLAKVNDEPDRELPDDPERLKKMFSYSKKAIFKYNHYDLANSESFTEEREALEQFDNYLDYHDDVILFIHNAPFDLPFVEVSEVFKTKNRLVFDTLEFFRYRFHPILAELSKTSERHKTLYNQLPGETKKSSALADLVKGFNPNPDEYAKKLEMAHEALTDCENTIDVFQKALLAIYQHLNT
jgi:DNA polymerase III epsilon subunit-like protein